MGGFEEQIDEAKAERKENRESAAVRARRAEHPDDCWSDRSR